MRRKCDRLVFQIYYILFLVQNPGFQSLRYNIGYLSYLLQPNLIIRVQVVQHYCPTNAMINWYHNHTFFLFYGGKVRKNIGIYCKRQVFEFCEVDISCKARVVTTTQRNLFCFVFPLKISLISKQSLL